MHFYFGEVEDHKSEDGRGRKRLFECSTLSLSRERVVLGKYWLVVGTAHTTKGRYVCAVDAMEQ